MPNYTFQCNQCGERFDVLESLQEHDQHREKCPKCGSKKVEQKPGSFFAQTAKKS